MARRCELTGKGVQTGNNVSHAHNKTRRRFIPNLQKVTLMSESLGRSIPLKVSVAAIRSVEKTGGLDAFLINSKDHRLGHDGLRLKKKIIRTLATQKS